MCTLRPHTGALPPHDGHIAIYSVEHSWELCRQVHDCQQSIWVSSRGQRSGKRYLCRLKRYMVRISFNPTPAYLQ
jgi:hypothetical protein